MILFYDIHQKTFIQFLKLRFILLLLSQILPFLLAVNAASFPYVQQCSPDRGGGVCPLRNTCCSLTLHTKNNTNADAETTTTTSGCIPSDLGALNATCCTDRHTYTGCGVGYQCDASSGTCVASSDSIDPLVRQLPRYSLCHLGPYSNFTQLNGFDFHRNNLHNSNGTKILARMPYYSSHGDLQKMKEVVRKDIQMVLVVIHGANRNADDYFCSATAAAKLQTNFAVHQILVVAPWFPVATDLPSNLRHSYLQWDNDTNGPWRYGAASVHPIGSNMSSFQVMDVILKHLMNLPNLHHLTIAGHSSGGQFVQRYALLSPQPSYSRINKIRETVKNQPEIRLVVANPSSSVYLIPERYNESLREFIVPVDSKQQCPRYNQWEWGLETTTKNGMATPLYVRRVLAQFYDGNHPDKPYHKLINRYATREVFYMAGSLDRCNVSSFAYGRPLDSHHDQDSVLPRQLLQYNDNQDIQRKVNILDWDEDDAPTTGASKRNWCNSHGLEITCMDQLQGHHRWERHFRYMEMLQRVGIPVCDWDCSRESSRSRLETAKESKRHTMSGKWWTMAMNHNSSNRCHQHQVVVSDVGHDHSLMFSSSQGLQVLFSKRV